MPVSSMNIAVIFSKTPRTVENAAKVMKMKKSEPKTLPYGIWLKMPGNVIKIKEGPASGSTP